MSYLWAVQVLLKDFAGHAEAMTRRLKQASEALAERTGGPLRYLASGGISKEPIARTDGITNSLPLRRRGV